MTNKNYMLAESVHHAELYARILNLRSYQWITLNNNTSLNSENDNVVWLCGDYKSHPDYQAIRVYLEETNCKFIEIRYLS